jgi:hypothetical protein
VGTGTLGAAIEHGGALSDVKFLSHTFDIISEPTQNALLVVSIVKSLPVFSTDLEIAS